MDRIYINKKVLIDGLDGFFIKRIGSDSLNHF